jgi:NAD(P)-dependent dehydrogenase (short-subunit alcohol dehydrogenase family)
VREDVGMDLGLDGRRALVTGASKGIGLAVARGLAAEGADVAMLARSEGPLEAAAAEVTAQGPGRGVAVTADTGDDASVAAAVARAEELLGGGIDILVNCAATPATGAAFGDDDLEREINVKVRGYLRCVRAVAPGMAERGWGRVVNVAGIAARRTGNITGTIRNVAVAAMTKNLADELGARGITVNVVHPGMTLTEASPANFAAAAERTGRTVEEVEQGMASQIAIGRLPTAEEVADVVVFLTGTRSVALNGDAIVAGGGMKGSVHY